MISDIVSMLSQKLMKEEITIPIRRGHVLEDALRTVKHRGFSVTNTINVNLLYIYIALHTMAMTSSTVL